MSFRKSTLLLCGLLAALALVSWPALAPAQVPQLPEAQRPILQIESGGHTAIVHWLQFTSDGRQLISAGRDKVVRIWDLAEVSHPKLVRSLRLQSGPGGQAMIYAGALDPVKLPGGKQLLALGGLGAVDSVLHYGDIQLLDFDTGKTLGLLQGHTDAITCLHFSAADHLLVSCSIDRTIRVWDLAPLFAADGSLAHEKTESIEEGGASYRRLNADSRVLRGHTDEVKEFAWIPPRRAERGNANPAPLRIVSAGDDHTLRIWTRGEEGEWTETAVLKEHSAGIISIACSPDGRYMASSSKDGSERLWDAENGKFLRLIGGIGHGSAALCFSPDSGSVICAMACGGDRSVQSRVWDLAANRQISAFAGHDNHVTSAAISRDGSLVASADGDNDDILLWDPRTGERRGQIVGVGRSVFAVGFSPDGRQAAFGNQNTERSKGGFARLEKTFDLADVRPGPDIVAKAAPAAGQADDPANGKGRADAWLRGARQTDRLEGEINPAHVLAIYAKATGDADRKLLAFVKRNQAHDHIHSYSFVPATAETPPLVVIGSEYRLTLHNAETGELLRTFVGHAGLVWDVAVSPDSRYLLSGSGDQTFRVWSLQNLPRPLYPVGVLVEDAGGKVQVTFIVAGLPAAAAGMKKGDVVLEIDGQKVESAQQLIDRARNRLPGAETRLKIVRDGAEHDFTLKPQRLLVADQAEPLLSVFVAADGEWVAWNPLGYYKASPDGDRLIGWHVNRGLDQPADFYAAWQFKRRFHRPDVLERILESGSVATAFESAEDERARLLVRAEKEQLLDISRDLSRLAPARVTVLEPRDGQAIRADSVLVRARVEIPGAAANAELHVRLNDRPVAGGIRRGFEAADAPAIPRSEPAAGRLVEMEIPLALAGQQKLEVFARTDDSTSQPVTIYLNKLDDASPAIKGDLHVLTIGVSQYKNERWNLGFAASDATGVAQAFQQQAGALYGNVHVSSLTDAQATRAAVTAALRKLALSATRPQDTAFVLLAGHGVRDPLNDYFFGTHDLDREAIDETAVPWTDLVRILTKMQCRVILALDTCHSGDLAGGWQFDASLGREISDLTDIEGGVVVLTSSKGSEFSLERSDWRHGAFSLALIEALTSRRHYQETTRTLLPADYDNDGVTLLTELQTYLVGRVHELTGRAQNPTVRHSGTPFPVSWVK